MHYIINDMDVAASGIHSLRDRRLSGPCPGLKSRKLWFTDVENTNLSGVEEEPDIGLKTDHQANPNHKAAHPEGMVLGSDS